MAEGCEEKSTCSRCLRSSVIASLFGFILVLIGGGAYAGATIFARRSLVDLLQAPHLFPCLDYVVYGLIGAICIFTLLAYLLCALSSGWNAKYCFDSHLKSVCGRCCNMTLLLLLVCAVLLWTAIAGLVSYPFISITIVSHRSRAPDPSGLLNSLPDASSLMDHVVPNVPADPQISPPNWPNTNANDNLVPTDSSWGAGRVKRAAQSMEEAGGQLGQPESWPNGLDVGQPNGLDTSGNHLPSVEAGDLEKAVSSVLPKPEAVENMANEAKRVLEDAAGTAARAGRQPLACSPNMVDLSYYGLYDENGLPIVISRKKLDEGIKQLFICVCVSLAGIFLLLLGYLQIIICTALNYARLQETRCYDTTDAGEEGVALQQ